MKWWNRRPKEETVADIQVKLTEKRPLPVGVAEFHEWSDRIIAGSMLPSSPEAQESQKFALTTMLINLKPTEAFESDLYFINCLRKAAANQVAEFLRAEIRDAAKARLAAKEAEKQNTGETTPPQATDGKVLEDPGVSVTK